MLIMFRTKNFTSFHDEAILDMRATGYKEHPSHVVQDRDFKLLKNIALYGANASGKSNLISALSSYEQYIFKQLFQEKWEEDQVLEQDDSASAFFIEPFLLTDKVDPCIEFEMIFSHNDTLYQYGFSFEETKIHTEWLLIDNEAVFDRKNQKIEYGRKYKAMLKDYKKYREDRLYLSVLDYFATDIIKDHIDNFKDFFQTKLHIYFELFLESSIKGTMGSVISMSKLLVDNEEFRKKVAEYINRIDVGIQDLIIEYEPTRTNKGVIKEMPVVKTVHEVYDSSGSKTGTKVFDLRQESTGTLRFLSFIQRILMLLEDGGVFVVDELSARLHPLLTKFIVDMFQSSVNKKSAQLIFTTHDISLLNKEQFRRDEVLFVDKNERGESVVYSLADLKTVRQDATYNKDYFSGKYGAIPVIQEIGSMNGGESHGQTETVY